MTAGSQLASPRMSSWLHLIRWLAALAVVVTHVNNRLFVPWAAISKVDRTPIVYAWTFVTGFAHQAVMIFFVMSGYLIGGSVLLELRRTGDLDLVGYLVKRVVRLAIVLWPALLLGAIVDRAGLATAPPGIVYQAGIEHTLGPTTLVCNAAFLQTIVCPAYGSNGALWSLAAEFWYYILWPLILLPVKSSRSPRTKLACIALAISLIVGLSFARFTTFAIVPYMAIWSLGVLPFVLTRPLLGRTTAHAGSIFIAILVGVRIGVRGTTWNDPVLGFALNMLVAGCFANFLIALRHDDHREALPGTRVYRWAADFSYSLYSIHIPVISVLGAVAVSELGIRWSVVPGGVAAWLTAFAYIVTTLLAAYLFSLLTENNTAAVRRWVMTMRARLRLRTARSS